MVNILRKELTMDFKIAVEHIQKILKEEGFSILTTKAIDEILKKKFNLEEYPKFTTILACSPKLAKMGLDVVKEVGTLYPCSFCVYEDEGKIFAAHTSIMQTAVEIGLASKEDMKKVIEETSKIIHAAWNRI